MGNNSAFSDFETLVVNLYDAGKLDLVVLDIVGEVAGSYPDIDAGGQTYETALDGLGVEAIVIKILDPDHKGFNSDEIEDGDEIDYFQTLTKKRWGWTG